MLVLDRIRQRFEGLHAPGVNTLRKALSRLDVSSIDLGSLLPEQGLYPQGAKLLLATPSVEVFVQNWLVGQMCPPSDNGLVSGWIGIVTGSAHHRVYRLDEEHGLRVDQEMIARKGQLIFLPAGQIHAMGCLVGTALVTLHVHSPQIARVRRYDRP